MIRKILLSTVAATGLVGGLALTPATADAHPPAERYHHRVEVLYRRGHHGWQVYGTYRDRFEADRAADHLRHRGFAVEVRGC